MSEALLALLAFQTAILAPESAARPPQPAPQEEIATVRLPILTVVRLVVLDDLSGKGAVPGQEFELALAEPVQLAGNYIIPAGTRGRGWVVHADKPRFGGTPGELLLGARHLQLGDIRIPLRSMKLGGVGKDNSDIAIALAVGGGAVGGVASMFITGKDARVANGLAATAKVAADIDLPLRLLTPLAVLTGEPSPAASTPTSTTEE